MGVSHIEFPARRVLTYLSASLGLEAATRVLSAPWAPVTVRPAILGRDAAAIGAALAPVRALLLDPLAPDGAATA